MIHQSSAVKVFVAVVVTVTASIAEEGVVCCFGRGKSGGVRRRRDKRLDEVVRCISGGQQGSKGVIDEDGMEADPELSTVSEIEAMSSETS